jgi:importin-4
MGPGFAPFLPALVPHILEVVARSDATEVNIGGEAGEFDLGDDEEDEEGETYLQIRTALLDVKRTAIIALGMIAENSGPAFGQYLQNSLLVLLSKKDYFHSKIRIEIVKALG